MIEYPTHPAGRQRPFIEPDRWQRLWCLLVALSLPVVAGCANSPAGMTDWLDTRFAQVDAVDPPPPGGRLQPASTGTLNGDPQRLAADVQRSIRKSHWGLLKLESRGIVDHNDPEPPPPDGPVVVAARALLPNDLEAHIVVWETAPQRVSVAIRVGSFGNANLEHRWLHKFADVLAGPPAPKRFEYRLPHLP